MFKIFSIIVLFISLVATSYAEEIDFLEINTENEVKISNENNLLTNNISSRYPKKSNYINNNYFYINLSAGISQIAPLDKGAIEELTNTTTGADIIIGYSFNKLFSLEAGYTTILTNTNIENNIDIYKAPCCLYDGSPISNNFLYTTNADIFSMNGIIKLFSNKVVYPYLLFGINYINYYNEIVQESIISHNGNKVHLPSTTLKKLTLQTLQPKIGFGFDINMTRKSSLGLKATYAQSINKEVASNQNDDNSSILEIINGLSESFIAITYKFKLK